MQGGGGMGGQPCRSRAAPLTIAPPKQQPLRKGCGESGWVGGCASSQAPCTHSKQAPHCTARRARLWGAAASAAWQAPECVWVLPSLHCAATAEETVAARSPSRRWIAAACHALSAARKCGGKGATCHRWWLLLYVPALLLPPLPYALPHKHACCLCILT